MDVTNVMHVHVALVLAVLVLVAATMAAAAKKPKRLGGGNWFNKGCDNGCGCDKGRGNKFGNLFDWFN